MITKLSAKRLSYFITATAAIGTVATTANAAFDLGPGSVYMEVGASVVYDKNVFTNAAELSDTIFSLTPSVTYAQTRGLVNLTATAAASINEYRDYTKQSGINKFFGFELSGMHRNPAPDSSFTLSGDWSDAATASEEVANRIDIESYNLAGSFDMDLSEKTGFRLSGGYGERNYDDAFFADSEDYNVRGDFLYAYSEKLTTKLGYRYREISQRNSDLKSETVTVGAEGVLSPKLTGSVELGGTQGDELDGTQFYYSVGLDWAVDQNTSASITGSRDSTPSALAARATNTDLRLTVNQRFTQSLSGAAYVGLGRFEREDIQARDDDIVRAGASLNLGVTDNGSLVAGIDYEDRDSNAFDSTYERLVYSVGGSVRF